MKKLFIIITTICFAAFSCSKSDEVNDGSQLINLGESEYEFGIYGGDLDFDIFTNVAVAVTISDDAIEWIEHIDTRSTKRQSLHFEIDDNFADEDREGVITISGGHTKLNVVVKQKGAKEIIEKERAALIALYNATGGDNWKNNDNWCSDKPLDEWYGIEAQVEVRSIDLRNNNLTGCITSELDALQGLWSLYLQGNNIEKLNISGCKNLGIIKCADGQLNALKLSDCDLLEYLYAENNKIKSLEVTNCPNLIELYYKDNPLQSLDLSHCARLSSLYCGSLQLQTLNVSKCESLSVLDCSDNQLQTLNVSECESLRALYCVDNQLQTLNMSRCAINQLNCSNNQLKMLNVTGCLLLDYLLCSNNQLQKLNVSGCTSLDYLCCDNNQLQTLNVSGCKYLSELHCYANQLQTLNVSECTSLSELHCYNNQLQTLDMSECKDLNYLYCYANQLQSIDVSKCVKLKFLDAHDNPNLSNIYIDPKQSFKYSIDSNTSFTYNKDYDFYESTDYSQDGAVKQLQQATKGAGIDIVIMGDGFSDRLIADGTYDEIINKAIEGLFSEEPYKSFRNYFNVYQVTAVSKHEGYEQIFFNSNSTAIGCYFGDGTRINGDDRTVFLYAEKAIGEDRIEDAILAVVVNSPTHHGTAYMYGPENTNSDWGNGAGIAYFTICYSDHCMSRTFIHEVGHSFAKLADEYIYDGYEHSHADSYHFAGIEYGWRKNIDFTNDPTKVKWKHFLEDPRYANEGLGCYEGAKYGKGVWRPTEISIMRSNDSREFNAPSREAIYYRIHKLAHGADWQYDYEKFVEWDAINRKDAKAAATRSVPHEFTTYEPTHPPVIINKTWKDEMRK